MRIISPGNSVNTKQELPEGLFSASFPLANRREMFGFYRAAAYGDGVLVRLSTGTTWTGEPPLLLDVRQDVTVQHD